MSDKQNDGGSIFPLPAGTERVTRWQAGHGEYETFVPVSTQGMSLRDYFAAHAPDMPDSFRLHYDTKLPHIPYPCLAPITDEESSFVDFAAKEGYGESDLADEYKHLWQKVKALQECLDNRKMRDLKAKYEAVAAWRYFWADMMLDARSKTPAENESQMAY